jgi:hypothetical protein
MSTRARGTAALFAILLWSAGCATAPPSLPSAQVGVDGLESPLVPVAAAQRASERAVLTGMELGRMWTFQDPPLAWWQEAYGFTPSADWLDHVRLASVRYGAVCSASFVSPDGLVMTNHHCARGCIEELSTPDADYLEDGFYAPTHAEELECPGLYVDQLQSVDDVTSRVLEAASGLTSDTARARAQAEAAERIEAGCEEDTGLTCQVVSLYHGGRFHLYRYQRFQPVRLVFAPEHQAASFGGDPDNFTYPRYSLDVAFLRAYDEDGEPLRGEPYFRWSAGGAAEGEAVFVVGSPGSTSRLLTVSQVMYEKNRRHPYIVQYLTDIVELYRWIGQTGPDAERSVREQLANLENALKAYTGQLGGLQDTLLVGQKIRWESELRAAVHADPALRAQYGDVWDRITHLQREKLPLGLRAGIYNIGFIGDPHIGLAGQLVRWAHESALPPEERGEQYGAERLAEIERRLLAPTGADPDIAARLLAIRLRLARDFLPTDDPLVRAAFQPGETPLEAAERLVRTSQIMEPEFRRRLVEGGAAAVALEDDLSVRLALIMEETRRDLVPRLDQLQAAETVQEERLANALFAVEGTSIPPDATFTLRISDGVVARYPYNGTIAAPHTTFYGIFERASAFGDAMPFTLPASYAAARNRLDLAAPLNFVSTNDITGGNSGSPMINRAAEIVGVAFDGNIESLPNEWLFQEETGRTVGVHSAGIMEALRSIYRADALVQELLGQR